MKWQTKKIRETSVEIVDGDRGKNYPKQDEFYNSGYCLFLNAKNVTSEGFKFENCQFISEEKDQRLNKGKLHLKDIVLTTRGTLGYLGYYDEGVPYENIRINSGMVILRSNESDILPYYLYLYLRSSLFQAMITQYKSGVAQPQLPIKDMKEISISYPDISTQSRIVSILKSYDDFIENNLRRIALLEEAARLLYQEWFVRLRFPGFEHARIVDGVPEGWESLTAFDAMDVLSGGTPKTDNPSYWNGNIQFFTPKDATATIYVTETEKTITDDGLKKCNSKLYPKDTLFITARGTVGKLNLAQQPMAMNQSCYALRGKGNVTQYYLYCALKASIEQFQKRAAGAVFDAIIVDTFKLIPFVVPNNGLIEKFDHAVTPIFNQTELLILQNQKLKQARDLLLPKLISGEVTV